MAYFNGFQLVLGFSAAPFLITYVKDATFYAHSVLFWVLIVAYIVGFAAFVGLIGDKFSK